MPANIYERSILFDTSNTVYNGSGIDNVLGIAFSLIDSDGVELMGVDWNSPQIIPATDETYTLDLSTSPVQLLFQKYQIIGYIKDADGTVYQTVPVLKNICQPNGINESGYVDGLFAVTPDCINNVLSVKEFTVFTYNNLAPVSVTKNGTLYYPSGTISGIAFTGTPFNNNEVYTGEYRINCTSEATYDLGDDIFVVVTYLTNQPFDIVCSNFIGDITCCLTDTYNIYIKNCENAVGQAALQKYNSVLPSFLNGLAKQINGQDASSEVAYIRKQLNCNCGKTSAKQNEITPVNPAVYSIVLNGVGGTSIPSPTITGSTKTYNIASSSYVIAKGDTGDAAFTITTDTSVTNVVKYKITFNYDTMAPYILTAIAANPTLINQLNSLITATGGASIVGLDGKCVIDLTTSSYSVSQAVNGSTLITSITINGIVHNAPGSLFANDATSVASWLNSLTLGTFTAVYNSGTLTIQSVSNTNVISTITFTTPNITKQFAATNATLVQVLQAIINYLCNLTTLQIALSNNLDLCTFDYNGNIVTTRYNAGVSQQIYNSGIASAICNLTTRINTLAATTCDTFKTIFIDRPSTSFGTLDRVYGTLGGDCSGLTDLQIATLVFNAVSKYSAVKTLFCAIDCSTTPTCPDISNTNLNMSGANIGVYGLTWGTTPIATQTVSVKYRVTGTATWNVANNALQILPNGNLSGSSPYLITGLTVGTTYDVWIQNNCGGNGFVKQITTPTGSVYSGSFLLDTVLYNICGESPVTLYSSNPFASGTIMYTNIGLTVPVTGYTYITQSGSNIFELNSSTGVVGLDTTTACSNGSAGSYKLGNDTGTICATSPVTLYTSGSFAVGKVLYTDSALVNQQTGYSYVVFNAIIYTLNSTTGAVTGITGLSCTPPTTFEISTNNSSDITLTSLFVNGSSINLLGQAGGLPVIVGGSRYSTDNLGATPASIYIAWTASNPTQHISLLDSNGILVHCIDVSTSGNYTFTGVDLTGADPVTLQIEDGGC